MHRNSLYPRPDLLLRQIPPRSFPPVNSFTSILWGAFFSSIPLYPRPSRLYSIQIRRIRTPKKPLNLPQIKHTLLCVVVMCRRLIFLNNSIFPLLHTFLCKRK
ncbi:hypothetical protein FOXG_21451 [Fusarium oxysporum f. sp. lycopersici 4287]|uniref:Uncharacterized protein n=1 Tax=Fusarium oxysporum f. sp. lycopersici (strain 4287 / CBS 123668 / FGSC 9935 / NRRL 34936) TaxID=426428 RepID=A0A0J9VY63_FUSO4|nr:hypothetical protein FOXG_21451 [Fusarium oxysporum f. sp. lycopersici 4287]EWZ77869.1 hypothetical protein FOWG_17762 [Fusarium oxysporum f. sp. lycopersici MN25]KNB15718.1 hypothetical protein FOXG_21451 [Fusarium oxysporum f. sp. lycopersici 4287]